MITPWLPLLLLAFGGGPSQDPAPANRWHTLGGGSARTGETLTAPVVAPVEVVWTHEVRGVIEGEPLIWDEWILITVRQGPDLCVLRALDLLDGTPLVVDHVVRSRAPLEPSIWRDRVVYRAGPQILTALQLSTRRFEQVWTRRADGPVGPPLLLGSAVCATIDGRLTRFSLGSATPVWEQAGQFRGRVAVRDGQVYALDYDSAGRAFVARHDWATGAAHGRHYAGHHGGAVPELTNTPGVHVLGAGIFAHFEQPLAIVPEREVRVVGLSAVEAMDPLALLPLAGSTGLTGPPAAWGSAWVGSLTDVERGPLLVLKDDPLGRDLRVLASEGSNPDFIPREIPVTVADGVGFVGAKAFDLETSRVLWKLPLEATTRTVLARETVLVVDAGRRLVAIRRAAGSGATADRSAAPERVEQGRLVLRDGSIAEGAFELDTRAGTVALKAATGREAWPLAEVLLLEDATHRALLGRDVVRGVQALVERDLGRAYLKLANDARASNDLALLEELVQEAWEHGVSGRELDAARRTLEVLRARPGTLRRSLADELRARRTTLGRLPAEAFWLRTTALGPEVSSAWRLAFLRATLEQDASHGPASKLVSELVPRALGRSDDAARDPLEWLTYLEATRRAPVRLVRVAASVSAARTDSERALAQARVEWRNDLVGFESEHLLILTSLKRPGTLARCLALGELVCEALGSILPARAVPTAGAEQPKLLLHLYETQAEYLEHSNPNSGEAGAGLSWTAGHYNPLTNTSSIFVPLGADAFEQVMETYAHELTHHWLAAQRGGPMTRAIEEQPGYWVVEGFASLVDEFEFDLARGEWHTRAPLSRRQDLVASTTPEQLLPWETLYGLSHAAFAGMSFEAHPGVGSRCYLGLQQVVSGRHLFYAQAASTCRYLFEAEDPRLRQALLDYLAAYYAGAVGALDIEQTCGLTPAELGARTRAHARASLGVESR